MSGDGTTKQPNASDRHLDEILAELMRAVDAGHSIELDEWLTRYPDFAADLKEYFEKQEHVERLVRPLRQAAAQVLHVRCPHCHNPIELLEDVRLNEVSCPSCGSSFSLVGEKTVSHYRPGERTIGHFQLLDRVGVGAFGSVWKARDTQLDRTVAVKIPRNTQLDESQTELFLRDARVAAQLKHPNIVGVHEVGKQDDTIYIVSDFIQGATLKEWVGAKRLTPRESAELCVKIATALHHAHESGVIHRDLKPGNIMMDLDGQPHIVDFGLAKRDAGEITMTVEGQILGTPAYMPPEQARGEGHTVDRRGDVYALGVILFELLTGELPFRGDKQMLILQILKEEPPKLRKLNISVPVDLETICLKCLEKEPEKRYATAAAVVSELSAYLCGKPIQARPIGRIEKTWRWCRRNPMLSAAALLLILASITSSGLALWAKKERQLAVAAANAETHQRMIADQKTKDARKSLYHADILIAKQYSDSGQLLRLATLLDRYAKDPPDSDLRAWEWYYLKSWCETNEGTLHGHTANVRSVSWSRHNRLATAGEDATIKIWNTESWELVNEINGHDAAIGRVSWSPDGQRLGVFDDSGAVKIWSVGTGKVIVEMKETVPSSLNPSSLNPSYALDWSPDGGKIATAVRQKATIWDAESGERLLSLVGRTGRILSVAFSPDGTSLAVGVAGEDIAGDKIWIYDAQTGESRTTLPAPFAVISVAWSHDGSRLAASGYHEGVGHVQIWKSQKWDTEKLIVHKGCSSFEWGAQSETLASTGRDGTIKIWDAHSWKEILELRAQPHRSISISWSQDGNRLATSCPDNTVRIWNTRAAGPDLILNGATGRIAWSPDGLRIAATDRKSKTSVQVFDATTGSELRILTALDTRGWLSSLAWSPDGSLICATYWHTPGKSMRAGQLVVWDAHTADLVFSKQTKPYWSVTWAKNGEHLVCGGFGVVSIRDSITGEQVYELSAHTERVGSVAVSPNGRFLASSCYDQEIKIWDMSNWTEKLSLRKHKKGNFGGAGQFSIAWNNKSDRLAAATCQGWIVVWSLDGREIFRRHGHGGNAWCVAWSPDGKRLASGGDDRIVKIWDAQSGTELVTFAEEAAIGCVAWSPDGRRLAYEGAVNNGIKIRDASIGLTVDEQSRLQSD